MTAEAEAVENVEQIDNSPHKEFIRSLSHVDRDKLGALADVSGAYITSLVYRKADTCSLAIAIAIDQYSNGKYDFRDLLQRQEAIDWDYVYKKLNAERKG